MSTNTTFGATIVPNPHTADRERIHAPSTLLDSPALTPAASHDDMVDYLGEKPIPPHSPFYTHPPSSNEVVRMTKSAATSRTHLEKDLENGPDTPLSHTDGFGPFSKNLAVQSQTECTMWPSKQTLKQQQQANKLGKRNKRACAPVLNTWSGFTKRQRLFIKIAIALFVLGAAVGLGVGISVAVKGAYFTGDGKSQQVGVIPDQD
ncbi:uncharacterized protein RCC_03953 [Ramularia collo-cygni]|uniref:Uncharacterized protein n=1 Tax=Ramularia collo-cygni TaxID=112498 RepID=A0A2D3VC87_9PEZI|nr:uncharacterized protein RCC_03953 [Ramularia collo-cygni]CZT18113.1 uncharacterized protein RCC_03953 [Ramularia collo-cygni]